VLLALTPLGKLAQARGNWVASAAGYTAGGLLSGALVAAALATAGGALGAELGERWVLVVLTAGGLVAAARELARLPLPLPQMRRATRDAWARRWGHRRAAFAWGIDIGSFFTTWLTFAGAWWFVLVVALSGDVLLACGLMAAYWAGRAAVVWVGPLLVPDAVITPRLPVAWQGLERPLQVLHGATVLVGVAVVLALA
jgi:MFS family permease